MGTFESVLCATTMILGPPPIPRALWVSVPSRCVASLPTTLVSYYIRRAHPNPVPPHQIDRATFSEMDNHRLKTWLQLHLATDASAVTNLPFVLNSLAEEDFLSQGHVQKWSIRINSLIHSKDPGARWAGLTIALRTAALSRNVMNECAHGWITVALPMLFVSSRALFIHIATLMTLPPIEIRDLVVYQSLHPFDTVHLLEQRRPCRISPTGRPSKYRQVFSSRD